MKYTEIKEFLTDADNPEYYSVIKSILETDDLPNEFYDDDSFIKTTRNSRVINLLEYETLISLDRYCHQYSLTDIEHMNILQKNDLKRFCIDKIAQHQNNALNTDPISNLIESADLSESWAIYDYPHLDFFSDKHFFIRADEEISHGYFDHAIWVKSVAMTEGEEDAVKLYKDIRVIQMKKMGIVFPAFYGSANEELPLLKQPLSVLFKDWTWQEYLGILGWIYCAYAIYNLF